MRIISYGCANYKPFKEDASFEVRPLTLIYGKNSSGKSAGLRLLRLILRALSARMRGAFPLEVEELTFGSRFRDLVHGRLPHGSASFQVVLEAEDETLDLSATVQNVAEAVPSQGMPTEYSVVSYVDLRSPSSTRLTWKPAHGAVATYEGIGPLPFRGLLPDTTRLSGQKDRDIWRFAEEWRDRVQAFEGVVEHLGPHRCSIQRVYEAGSPRPLGYDGSGAPGRLAADDALLYKAAAWYQEHLDGWQLSLSRNGGAFECTLSRGDTKVNLAWIMHLGWRV